MSGDVEQFMDRLASKEQLFQDDDNYYNPSDYQRRLQRTSAMSKGKVRSTMGAANTVAKIRMMKEMSNPELVTISQENNEIVETKMIEELADMKKDEELKKEQLRKQLMKDRKMTDDLEQLTEEMTQSSVDSLATSSIDSRGNSKPKLHVEIPAGGGKPKPFKMPKKQKQKKTPVKASHHQSKKVSFLNEKSQENSKEQLSDELYRVESGQDLLTQKADLHLQQQFAHRESLNKLSKTDLIMDEVLDATIAAPK